MLLHGDLYARHLLVDASHDLCGVIDWGDVCIGDPSIDLGIAWSFFPAEGRRRFFAIYGEVDAATAERARFNAVNHAIAAALPMTPIARYQFIAVSASPVTHVTP